MGKWGKGCFGTIQKGCFITGRIGALWDVSVYWHGCFQCGVVWYGACFQKVQ